MNTTVSQTGGGYGRLAGLMIPGVVLVFSYATPTFSEPKMMVMGLGCLVLLLLSIRKGVDWRIPFRVLLPWLVLLCVGLVLGLVAVPMERWPGVILPVCRGGLVLLMGLSLWGCILDQRFRMYLDRCIYVTVYVVAVLAIGQRFGELDWLFPVFPHYDQVMYSVFGNQDLLGGFLAMGLPLLFCVAVHPQFHVYGRGVICVVMMMVLYVLVESGSRSAWLAAGVGIGFAVLYVRAWQRWDNVTGIRWGWGVAFLVVLIPLGGLIWSRLTMTFGPLDVGGNLRVLFYDGTLRMIAANPLWGVGLGQYHFHSPYYFGEALWVMGGERHHYNNILTLNAHNDVLQLGAELGVLGLVLLAWGLWRIPRRHSPYLAGLAAFGVFALLNPAVHSPAHAFFAVVLLLMHCGLYVDREAYVPQLRRGPVVGALVAVVIMVGALTVWEWVPGCHWGARKSLRGEERLAHLEMEYAYGEKVGWHGQGEVLLGLAVEYCKDERWEEGLVLVEQALAYNDSQFVHQMLASITDHLGHEEAAEHFRAVLWRVPNDTLSYRRLWPYLSEAEQVEWRAYAERFGVYLGEHPEYTRPNQED